MRAPSCGATGARSLGDRALIRSLRQFSYRSGAGTRWTAAATAGFRGCTQTAGNSHGGGRIRYVGSQNGPGHGLGQVAPEEHRSVGHTLCPTDQFREGGVRQPSVEAVGRPGHLLSANCEGAARGLSGDGRGDGVGPDAVGSQFDGVAADHADYCAPGDHVGGRPPPVVPTPNAGCRDDRASSGLLPELPGRVRVPKHHRHHEQGESVVGTCRLDVDDDGRVTWDARIVDHDVELAVLAHGRRHQRFDLSVVGDVGVNEVDGPTQTLDGPRAGIVLHVADDDVGALGDERLDSRESNAAASATDDRHLAAQVVRHGRSP